MSAKPFALIAISLAWLAVDAYLMVGNVVLRETRFGIIAQFLDRLPQWASNPVFICFWAILLLGWTVPLTIGFRMLRQNSEVR